VLALAVLAVLGALAVPGGLEAQAPGGVEPTDTVFELVLDNGETYYGHVESATGEMVVFRTLSGTRLEVERSRVRRLEPAPGRVVDGEVWAPDPNRTRLFFGPTGRALETGEGYVGLFELFFAFGAVGVGDRLVLAGGTPVLPEAMGEAFYLAPKLRVASVGRTSVAVGALAFFLTDEIDEGSVGLLYGVATHGTGDNAVTLGAGWGFALGGDDAVVTNEPVFLVGLERRISRRIKLVSENYAILVDGLNMLASGGVRLLGERFSADLGLGGAFGEETACCIPVLSASYSF
jgi:hypothetical protein